MIIYDFGWLVGILEGEGCFMYHRQGVGEIRIKVKMTDKDIIENIHKVVGYGRINGPYRDGNEKHKEIWCWEVTGKKARVLAIKLYPYMGERRKAKIEELLLKTKL